MARAPIRHTPEVHVVLDTNALYTEMVDRLICEDLSDFIISELGHLGLKVNWLLPSIVIMERKQQMLNKGTALLEAVSKLENLLDHRLGISTETLKLHVGEAVRRQMEAHGMVEVELATERVEWTTIIERAACRQPPFTSGPKEKGFKDAVILETFLQVAESVPRTASRHRVFLLTGDGALQDAAKERATKWSNVSVVDGLDSLRTQLNAIAAQLTPEALAKILPKAKLLFTDFDNMTGLYFQWEIYAKIDAEFPNVPTDKPGPQYRTRVKTNHIYPPTFLKKEGQKVFFSSKIDREVEATMKISAPGSGDESSATAAGENALLRALWDRPSREGSASSKSAAENSEFWRSVLESAQTEIQKTGNHILEVHWSVILNKHGKLVNPSLEKIEYISSTWKDGS